MTYPGTLTSARLGRNGSTNLWSPPDTWNLGKVEYRLCRLPKPDPFDLPLHPSVDKDKSYIPNVLDSSEVSGRWPPDPFPASSVEHVSCWPHARSVARTLLFAGNHKTASGCTARQSDASAEDYAHPLPVHSKYWIAISQQAPLDGWWISLYSNCQWAATFLYGLSPDF